MQTSTHTAHTGTAAPPAIRHAAGSNNIKPRRHATSHPANAAGSSSSVVNAAAQAVVVATVSAPVADKVPASSLETESTTKHERRYAGKSLLLDWEWS